MMLPVAVLIAALNAAQQPPDAPKQEPAVSPANAQSDIDAGLAAFARLRFVQAQESFQKAYDEDPQSAAAAFYLGYATYKIAEPKRPFHPDKRKAAELFAKAYSLDPRFRPVWGTGAAPKKP